MRLETIIVELETGAVARLFLFTELGEHQIGAHEAAVSGFIFDKERGVWCRTATDTVVGDEISRTAWLSPPVRWWRQGEMPTPDDTRYRTAWRIKDGRVETDMAVARDVHRNKMRAAREPLLQALDVAYQRADETGDADAKMEIAKKKQALRDITKHPGLETAATLDDLEKITLP